MPNLHAVPFARTDDHSNVLSATDRTCAGLGSAVIQARPGEANAGAPSGSPSDLGLQDAIRPDGIARGSGGQPAPTRVIEVGAVTAGIAVPEGRGVRFFSSSPVFDRLDGNVFRSTEQAARAAQAHARPAPRRGERRQRAG